MSSSTPSSTPSLIQDARTHLNLRQRGREARLARLAAAGVPTDHAGLRAWLAAAEIADNERSGHMFFGETCRHEHGTTSTLIYGPKHGCRVISFRPWAHEMEDVPADEPRWRCELPNGCSTGNFETEAEALETGRAVMAQRGWFNSWAEAAADAERKLRQRLAARGEIV